MHKFWLTTNTKSIVCKKSVIKRLKGNIMTAEFSVGDQVFLKSGGQQMTIEEIEDTSISCVWFDNNKKIDRNTFPAATLKKAATPEEISKSFSAISSHIGR